MRRIKAIDGDIFRPRGQIARELDLAAASPREVISVLGPRLSEERRARIDSAIASRTRRLAVAVEGLHDPHNTAAVMRTADAHGVQDVHIIENGARFQSSRKVTQGAHKWIDVSVWKTPDTFAARARRDGRRILVADMEGSIPLEEIALDTPTTLVFGNEAEGITGRMRELADGAFRVPMYGFVESLNVSVAAAIAIAELRRGGQGDLPEEEALELKARFYLRAVRAGYDIVMIERERSNTV